MTRHAGGTADPCATLVDLQRYPVLDPDAGFVGAAREELGRQGWCELPGFVPAGALGILVEDAASLAPAAWRSEGIGTAYLAAPPPDAPAGDPRRWTGRYGTGVVAYDLFPPGSPLRRLYEWEPLRSFVEAILGRGQLYRYADPFGALNLAVMTEDDELQWHFDQTDFVVSLALQAATEGGDFEVAPLIRTDRDECLEAVSQVLSGASEEVRRIEMVPGTLLVFEGRRSIHRVSPVRGNVARLVALLAYDTKPGTVSTPALRKARYGRER
ncbi:MAG TPA: hypothetical protein VKU92_12935 [Acidimicrobiales bacterium]|nr:hypothetical protein [Acidimicrobiales bacterium]